MALPIPTEAEEQINLVGWLRLNNIDFFRVPNETYTKSWRQKSMNKALGVTRGVPDLFIIVNKRMVAIEMKRTKGSVTSPEQLKWIELLNMAKIPAKICYGCDEAIEFIKQYK